MNEYINLTLENIDKEHICCAIGDPKHQNGVDSKKEWIKNKLKDGHVFRKLNARGKAFIEYEPIETAWVPINGKNYEYIYCLWVAGSFKGKGIGKELLDNPLIGNKYTKHQKDMMLFGLLIHDGLKRGLTEEKYTRFDHPILMANFVLEHQKEAGLNEEDALFISEVIKTHMGPYTRDYNGDEILEIPKTKYQSFVHMCDYLASRKFLEIRFDENNNIIF